MKGPFVEDRGINIEPVEIVVRRKLCSTAGEFLLLPGVLHAQTVTATIPVPAVDVAVNPVTNTLYALSNGNTVAVIDGATNNIGEWQLGTATRRGGGQSCEL